MQSYTGIEQVIAAFVPALLSGNVDALADLYEEDATFYNIGSDVVTHGRPAIRAAWQGFVDSTDALDFIMGPREETVSGDYGFAHMTFVLKSRPRGTDTEPIMIEG